MRAIKSLLPVLAAIILLQSCSGGVEDEDILAEFRDSLGESPEMLFAADIRADYGDRLFDCSVSFSGFVDGGTITVSAPELIAGVTVELRDGGATLEFDGAEVYTGEILPDGMSPVDAIPLILSTWRDGLATETVRETVEGEECLSVLFRVDDRVTSRTWIPVKTLLPLRSEIALDGYTVIGVDFRDMKLQEPGEAQSPS